MTVVGAFACQERQTPPTSSATSASAPVPEPTRLDRANERRSDPTQLISLPISAYHASISADDDAAYLLANQSAYRLVPGRAPESLQVRPGFGATTARHALVFWSDGAVRAASKRDGKSRKIAALATPPQALLSSGSDTAWIERSNEGRFSLMSSSGKPPLRVYASPGTIEAAAMLSDWIFFIERPTTTEWRVGGIRANGGAPVFTSSRTGRAPSMLVARHELFYYDGNQREVRRLSPDLRGEETLVSNFVCSPIAVAEQVYCANVQGIFELVPGARPRPLVTLSKGGAVTDLAANASHLYWIGDAGADKLQVSAVALAQ
jgi:hypothetical protein